MHVPVLLHETLEGLALRPGSDAIDATLGGAGHAHSMLLATSPDGRLLGLDADSNAIERGKNKLTQFGSRVILVQANFDQMRIAAGAYHFEPSAILLDLGLSSFQLADDARGFSFLSSGPLDMRFDVTRGQSASDLINGMGETDLANLIFEFGEERFSRRIARVVVQNRPIRSAAHLAEIISTVIARRDGIHPATRTFQALRIAVNDELGVLVRVLPQALTLLKPAGRLAVISFHSLEDRIVKQFMQKEASDCICPPRLPSCVCGHKAQLRIITKKPILPTSAEVLSNPRSRSARLRIAEKLA